MAFPIPSHLPRKKAPQDVSTEILTKISDTPAKGLTADVASSWVAELSENITQTKRRIHERIDHDLPSFNRQLAASKSVQDRLDVLTTNVDKLETSLSDSTSGLIPRLLSALKDHSSLAQEVENAGVHHRSLQNLQQVVAQYRNLTSLISKGKLPDAVQACFSIENALQELSPPLDKSAIMLDLKNNFRASRNRTDEQLNDAYSRSIQITSSELVICPSVQVRQSDAVLTLSSVLSSLSPTSLGSQLTSLRRDIISLYIERISRQPSEVTVTQQKDISGVAEHRLSLFPSPPNHESLSSRLETLSTVLAFLNSHLFPHLPASERSSFPRSLSKAVEDSVLQKILASSLPSSLDKLPEFLAVVKKSIEFEEMYVVGILGDDGERIIKTWGDNVATHYERKRRTEILDHARTTITRDHTSPSFQVEVELKPSGSNTNGFSDLATASEPDIVEADDDSAWGFGKEAVGGASQNNNGEVSNETVAGSADEEGWGFDDEVDADADDVPGPQPVSSQQQEAPQSVPEEEDPWGWNDEPGDASTAKHGDDKSEAVDDTVWDEPWSDEPRETSTSTAKSVPKPATRLAKFSAKGKTVHTNGHSSPPAPLPVAATASPPKPAPLQERVQKPVPTVIKESYLVSGWTKELLSLVQHSLSEASQLDSSAVFADSPRHGSSSLIVQAASLILDLYRGLYPITRSVELVKSPKLSMTFSNDCLYMSGEVEAIVGRFPPMKEQFSESSRWLEALSKTWFDETIDRQIQFLNESLDHAGGFVDTTDQDRFDSCEEAVSAVLKQIRVLASQWKGVLTKSKYYMALGAVVNAALSRILRDILALPDITADESHRLCELCHVLNALEGTFVEDSTQPSFVVAYVPSWLKYSYLSELLEASIADISYLFQEGLLVDFEIDELVQLVRALFTDTPLRANTISRLQQGHPISLS